MVIKAQQKHMCKASPCDTPQNMKSQEDRWLYWLEINLAYIAFSHIIIIIYYFIDASNSEFRSLRIDPFSAAYLVWKAFSSNHLACLIVANAPSKSFTSTTKTKD